MGDIKVVKRSLKMLLNAPDCLRKKMMRENKKIRIIKNNMNLMSFLKKIFVRKMMHMNIIKWLKRKKRKI